jgi:hypothetical protein
MKKIKNLAIVLAARVVCKVAVTALRYGAKRQLRKALR